MDHDVVIIGAGIMGSAAAYWLSKEGKSVLLIDQFGIENSVNASYDYSRIFRYSYGDDEFYTNMAVEALKLWRKIEKESENQLYFNCGVLDLCNTDEDWGMHTYSTLKRLGHDVELISEREFPERFPQFRNVQFGVLDENGGLVEANTAVRTFVRLAEKNGAAIRENEKIMALEDNSVRLEAGEAIGYDKLVLTCGSWTNNLVDAKLPLNLTKGQMLYLRPRDAITFTKEKLPCFISSEEDFWGIPLHGVDGVKFAMHGGLEEVDSPDVKRSLSDGFESKCRQMLETYIPELAEAKTAHTRVCLHDNTPDNDFIIDKWSDNVVIGCGFSGHGFKFAPLIGKILADLVLHGETNLDISRFALSRF